ncbi:MAG: polysaccharide ABC transporter ATP-binding protein [Pirellula sp.]
MAIESIHVDNVSKKFRLGSSGEYGRLTEVIASKAKNWFRRAINQRAISRPQSHSSQLEDGWFWALRDIQISIPAGDIVGIVGRNGAGKSTLLKILSRIVTPTLGRVGVRGRVGSLLEVGTGFHPELTGRENVFLNGAILGMPRSEIKRRFDEIVSFAEIETFLDTPVKRYSSGMAVRLAFAVAAHLEPDVLIIDEVLSVGDQAFQRKCLGKASQLGDQGRTILIVSHNLAAVANLCRRAILIEQGALVADGAPEYIIDRYLADSSSTSGVRVWEDDSTAPKSDAVRLMSVSVRGGMQSKPAGEIDIDQEILIAIEYRVSVPNTVLAVQIQLKDETGAYVLWSANAPSMNGTPDPWYGKPHTCGVYRTECRIPPNFLNDTRYFVSILLGPEVGVSWLKQDAALSFLVHDTGAMRREYTGSWIGPVVRPKLDWETHPVE